MESRESRYMKNTILILIIILIIIAILFPTGIIKKIWVEKDSFFSTFTFVVRKFVKEDILPIWQKMWEWFKNNIWSKIESWIRPEFEKRKEFLEEGFEREKEELKEELKTEVPRVSKSLWEKLKEFLK